MVKDKKVFIDDGKAEIIKHIFERYAIGESVPKIITSLNKQGLLHNSKPFTPNCVYSILKNKKYIGITQIDGESFDIYPRIISDELFNKVKKRLDANRFGKNGVKEVYLLRNKVRCGYCGNTISAGCGTSHNRSQVRYYACRGRTKLKNGCTKSAVHKEILENLVLDNIYKSLSSEEECEKAISYLMQLQDELAKESQSVKLLEKEKRQTETALNNLMSAIEQGIVSNTTNKRLHELETKLEEIENHILKEKAKTAHTLTRSQMKEYYLKALKLEPQLLIDYLVEEIVLYDDKVIIKYKSPIKNGPDESRDFSLCENISKMRVVVQNKREPVYKEILIVKTI